MPGTVSRGPRTREHGAALVEFALVLPMLLLVLLGIVEFGLYFYNDLQLTQVARDAARYASVGEGGEANTAIDGANLVSTDITTRIVDLGTSSNEAKVTLVGTYHSLTPLPALMMALFGRPMATDLTINASATMRRE